MQNNYGIAKADDIGRSVNIGIDLHPNFSDTSNAFAKAIEWFRIFDGF